MLSSVALPFPGMLTGQAVPTELAPWEDVYSDLLDSLDCIDMSDSQGMCDCSI